jgi:hypothetical protein
MHRLKTLVDIAKRRGEALGHILVVGPDGSGKSSIAHTVARELGVNLRSADASSIERAGDFAAIINDLDKGDVLFITNLNRLHSILVDVLVPAMRDSELNIVVGKGSGSRTMRLMVKPFTVIGTTQREGDCRDDLLSSFDLVLRLKRYSDPEMVRITEALAAQSGLDVEGNAIGLIAKLAKGSPRHAESLLKRLKLIERRPITERDAADMLSLFGYGPIDPAAHITVEASNWTDLSGVDFERLIVNWLTRLGFVAELTKATGDGGIDIEAHFESPIVGGRYLFQCKRFTPDTLVGSPTIREFYGALVADRKAVKGVLITTSGFTAQAREFATNLPLELIDGERLRALMSEDRPLSRQATER